MIWYKQACKSPCAGSRARAQARQSQLTKPAGSLGLMEDIAISFAAWQRSERPYIARPLIRVFAADHGVARQGVSSFPSKVTRQMIGNFLSGGAAISVLARSMAADFAVINMGTFEAMADCPGLINIQASAGTLDFSEQAAMSEALMQQCLDVGRQQIDRAHADIFIAGEMGIGNTTSAAAIFASLFNLSATKVTGRGTGIDDNTLSKKIEIIANALKLHAASIGNPELTLRCLGGLEIAAICGAYLRCAQKGIPILVDGFIATAAAAVAVAINPGVKNWLLAGHQSAEKAHHLALSALELRPILQLQLRLGEGSGAAIAMSIIRTALDLHNNMATFADAGVDDAD